MVGNTPSQFFDDAWESEDILEEPLDALDPSFYKENDDVVNNIDEFIHVGRCKWDVICP
jgi:hypothetical protein